MPAPDPGADLDLLTDAARAAGDIALRHFRRRPRTWDKPGGAGPVTEADLEIDRMLRDRLLSARGTYGWLSEETEDDAAARLACDTVFVVDPIDGTRAFVDGQSAFSHSLSVVHGGRPIAGVVYLPAQDRLFSAARGRGAALDGDRLHASDPAVEADATLLISRADLRAENWPGGAPPVARAHRPSLAYRLALVGAGRADGAVTLRPAWEWDIAAGALIATEAGARVTDAAGRRPVFNRAPPRMDGIVAAGPNLHRALLARRNA